MHHGKHWAKLGRSSDHRQSLLRNQTTAMLLHGSIRTTLAKAKAVKPLADKIITVGKKALAGKPFALNHARRFLYVYILC